VLSYVLAFTTTCCAHARSVTEAEAQKWDEERDLREQRAATLRQQLLEQYQRRGQAPPDVLLQQGQQQQQQRQQQRPEQRQDRL
jgi:hypothetical protein